MIARCETPPEFDLLPVGECYACSDDRGIYLYIGLETIGRYCACHAAVLRWSHTVAKQAKRDAQTIIDDVLRPSGVKILTATFPDATDKVWPKFVRLFGFPEPSRVMIANMEI